MFTASFARVSSSIALGALLFTSRAALASEPPAKAEPDTRSCAVERHVGISDVEADAVEEVVCSQVRSSTKHTGRYRVRITKIGSKLILTLAAEHGGRYVDEKQIALSSLDEVNIAAPRLLEASTEQKPVDETVDVTNVVGDETRVPKKKPSSVHAYFGVVGASAQGIGTGGGVSLGISAGSEQWSFIGELRIAGQAFNKPASLAAAVFTLGTVDIESKSTAFSYVGLSGGARHHFTKSDVSPFVGGGLALMYLEPEKKEAASTGYAGYPSYTSYDYGSADKEGKTGLGGYLELGLDVLRTRTIGGSIVLRGDLPAFTMEKTEPSKDDPSKSTRTTLYSPVLSAGIALRF